MAKGRRDRGEGSVYQRASDGRWVGVVDLGTIGGKRRRRTVYGATKREAQQKRNQLERQLTADLARDPATIAAAEALTVADYLSRWLELAARPAVRPSTYEGYEIICRVRLTPQLGSLKLTKLRALDIEACYAALREVGLAGRTIRNTHRCLHGALDQAVRWGLLTANPCDGVRTPRPARTEIHPLTADEVSRLLDGTAGTRQHALYTVAVTTGMRRGELLGLRWADLDLAAATLHVRQTVQRRTGAGLVFSAPKTASSRRTIHLTALAVAALKTQRAAVLRERMQAGPRWAEHDLVFPGDDGAPADPSATTHTFQRQLQRLGLRRVRFHDLRHTAATLLLGQNTHPKIVSELLGHTSITITMDTYSAFIPAMHQEAAAVLDRLFGTKNAS